MQTETETETLTETKALTWDDAPIPPERWGKSHMSTLLYVESRNVDGNGQPVAANMRTKNGSLQRGQLVLRDGPRDQRDYPTILTDGTRLDGHDDWDCVEDMVAEGLIDWEGTGLHPVLRLTSSGWALAAAARRHLAETNAAGRRTWDGFDPVVHLPTPPTPEEIARSQAASVGGEWTQDDLRETLRRMAKLSTEFYWACFHAEMAHRCHPFLEFNGILSKYVQLCGVAVDHGFVFPNASVHSGVALPMAAHDVDYFAEKFSCIFGPFFAVHPELADRFADKLVEGKP